MDERPWAWPEGPAELEALQRELAAAGDAAPPWEPAGTGAALTADVLAALDVVAVFAAFPGAIVMTSNCLIDPNVGQYGDRIFTRSIVGWPGVQHIEGDDFSAVIACAQAQAGFLYNEIP